MRRVGNIWCKIVNRDNLHLAYHKAIKGKSHRETAKKMAEHLEENLEQLYDLLSTGSYEVSPYRIKTIYIPKVRIIYALPLFPDNIVQHAILNILEPIWDSMFISDSYSCRKGKGQHKGVIRCMEFVKRYQYSMKCDISKFYPNIDHNILKGIIRHKIKDNKVLSLLDKVIDSSNAFTETPGKNVPIGNTLSQWFGNLYLNELDTLIKQKFQIKGYIRYCDDFILFADDKKYLHYLKGYLGDWLQEHLGLKFSYAEVNPTNKGVDFLGYRQFPTHILVRKSTVKRLVRRLKWAVNYGSDEYLRSFVASMRGWLVWAQSWNLRNKCENLLLGRNIYDNQKVFGFL